MSEVDNSGDPVHAFFTAEDKAVLRARTYRDVSVSMIDRSRKINARNQCFFHIRDCKSYLIKAMFQNLLPILKIYSARNVNYRFSVLAINFQLNACFHQYKLIWISNLRFIFFYCNWSFTVFICYSLCIFIRF